MLCQGTSTGHWSRCCCSAALPEPCPGNGQAGGWRSASGCSTPRSWRWSSLSADTSWPRGWPGLVRSVDRDDPVDRAPLGRADQVLVGDADRVQHRFDLAAPVGQEAVELGERGGDVVLLRDEGLQQARVIRHVVVDLHGREAVAFDLTNEIPVCHRREILLMDEAR